jgi:hypothetical protein
MHEQPLTAASTRASMVRKGSSVRVRLRASLRRAECGLRLSVAVGAAGTSGEHQDEPVFSAGSRLGWRIRSRARRISTSAEKRCSESNSSNTCVYVLQQVCGEWPACRATSAIDTPSLISGRRSCAAGHTDDLGQVAGLLPTRLPKASAVLSTSSSALTSTWPRKMPGHQRSPHR